MIINCIDTDPIALAALKSMFYNEMISRASNSEKIDFDSVYRSILKQLDNVDVETAAYVYQETKTEAIGIDKGIESSMTSEAELDSIASGANVRALIKRNTKDSPETKMSKAIVSLLNTVKIKTTVSTDETKALKQIIINYIKSVNKDGKTVGKTVDILAEAIKGDMDGSGLNTKAEEFFNNLQAEMAPILNRIKDPVLRNRLKNDISKISAASFKMGITETGRKKILYDALKDSEYGKKTKKGNVVVDWNRLAAQEDISKALDKVLGEKLDKLGYQGDKKKVYDALIDEYNAIKASSAYINAVKSMNLNGMGLTNKLAEQVAISRGFYKLVDGKKVVDWTIQNAASLQEIDSEMKALGIKTTNNLKKDVMLLVSSYVQKKDFSNIRESLLRLMELNNKPFKQRIEDIDRLINLQKVAGLDGTTSMLASKILGFKIEAPIMRRIDKLVRQYAELVSNTDTDVDKMREKFPWYDTTVNQDYSPAFFAQEATGAIAKEIGQLIKIASLGSTNGIVKLLARMNIWQQMVLSNILSNIPNLAQNLGTAITTSISSGKNPEKISNWDTFVKYFTHDYNSEGNSLINNSGIKNIYDAETPLGKVLAAIRIGSDGILRAIDGIAYTQGVSRSFYKAIKTELIIKTAEEDSGKSAKVVSNEVDAILAPYFSAETTIKAEMLAKEYLAKAGITKEKIGESRYGRILRQEIINVRRSFMMAVPFIKPERVLSIKRSAERLTEMEIGRVGYHVIRKGKREWKENSGGLTSMVASLMPRVNAKYNRLLDTVIKTPTTHNTAVYIGYATIRLFLNGGPLAFVGGASRFSDKAIGAIINIATYNSVSAAKNEFKEAVKLRGTKEAVNEDEVTALYEEYEMGRRRLKQSFVAWMSGLALVSATIASYEATKGDDDEYEWWQNIFEKSQEEIRKWGETAPIIDIFLKRVLPVQIRLFYVFSKLDKWDGRNSLKNVEKLTGTIMNAHVPTDPGKFVSRYFYTGKGVTGGFAAFTKDLQGSLFSMAPIFNFGGLTSFYNVVNDNISGTKKLDYTDSPIIPGTTQDPEFWDGVINGAAFGFLGYQASYALDEPGFLRTTGMEIEPKDYNKSFGGIDWEYYGHPEYNQDKELIVEAISKLDAISHQIDAFGKKFEIPLFDQPGDGKLSYSRWYKGIYSVSTKGLNLQKVEEFSDDMKIKEGENINVVAVALRRLGLKKLEINHVETAIKWRNLQEKLGK